MRISTRAASGAAAILLTAALLAASASGAAEPGGSRVSHPAKKHGLHATRVVRANWPTSFTFAPDGRLWYTQKQAGNIRVVRPGHGKHGHLFFHVRHVRSDGERGLLGIALDPGFPATPYVYVYATRTIGGHIVNQVIRLTDKHGHGRNSKILFHTSSPATNHNGGRLLFGPDGMLYLVIGDGADPANSQDLNSVHGKILRMTKTGAIPGDNPFGSRFAYTRGNRNSFGFTFDPQTGRLWETENGPECNDEINRIVAGKNYGWGPSETCSGHSPRDTNQDGPSPRLPLRWYTPTIAPTGITFCRGCGLGHGFQGAALFGCVNGARIRRLLLNGKRTDVRSQKVVYRNGGNSVLSMESAPNGTIYFSDPSGIFRLRRG
jgi:glucose/arabinose dehydrogenase